MSNSLSECLRELAAALPPEVFVTDPDICAAYSRDMAMFAPSGKPAAVVRARDTADVSTVLKACSKHRVPVHPRGAGSGLAGSSNAVDNSIVLSLAGMNQILEISTQDRLARLQPGVVNLDFRKALEPHGLFYPPDPSSYDWCTIGGNLSTNAGGLCCVKYGVTTDFVMGLEVVLADGEVLRTGRRTVKGVAGYDLTRVFVGAEGTLGVITEATVSLRPLPQTPVTLVATFESTASAGAVIEEIMHRGVVPSLLEIMDRTTIRAVDDKHHMGLNRDAAALLLAQSDTGGAQAEAEIEAIAAACRTAGALEVHTTSDLEEGNMFLFARRQALPALEGIHGATLIDDIAVPRSQMVTFLDRCDRIAEECSITVGVVGHAGDGNMHPTICLDPNDAEQRAAAERAFDLMLQAGLDLGGTITGEHGVGSIKIDWLAREIGTIGLRVHRSLKNAFDPLGILNPGKLFTPA